MARRHIRHGGNDRPRRRWRVKSLLALVAVVAAVWAAPAVIVQTSLRDRPLAAALAGIDGGITSGGATWRWLGGVEYRDVVLRDRAGRAAVILPYLALDRGLLPPQESAFDLPLPHVELWRDKPDADQRHQRKRRRPEPRAVHDAKGLMG